MGQLYQELQRRNVVRVALAYVVSAWLLIQVAETIFPLYGYDEGPARIIVTVLAIGFPLTLVLSWIYELTPEGLKLDRDVDRSRSIAHHTGKKLDRGIIVILTLALGYFAVDKFVLEPVRDTEREEAVASQARSAALVRSFGDKSIVVLPFADMSPQGDQEYFSDGIAEELLNLLAKINDLRVISRSSAFSFKGKDLDIPQIAEQLNVAHVLEGSVRKDGDDIRITVQLIDARSDTHLWSETYDRKLDDIFAIQDDIATAVVDELKITLLGEEPNSAETNAEAYTLYLQGQHLARQADVEAIKQAEKLLKRALAIDPRFAPAWIALAIVYLNQADPFGVRPVDEGDQLARDALQRALSIDPQNGPALRIMARLEGDQIAVYQLRQQALVLDPRNVKLLRRAGWAELNHGRVDQAIDLTQRAIAIDPLELWNHINLSFMYYFANRLEDAVASAQMVLSLNPDAMFPHYVLGRVLLAQGDAPAALAAMEEANANFLRLNGTAIVQHALGDADASDAALQAYIDKHAANGGYIVAEVYAFRGEIDKAFEWLEQAFDNDETGGVMVLYSPLFANLHDDARWKPFLDKMGVPH